MKSNEKIERMYPKRIEITEKGATVTLECRLGRFKITDKNNKIKIGEQYLGKLEVETSSDFIGDNPEQMKIGTCSYILAFLTKEDGEIIYEK